MASLVQLTHPQHGRSVALVRGEGLHLLPAIPSIYDLAGEALRTGGNLAALAEELATGDELDYERVHKGESEWRWLPAFDHPSEPARCLVSGTGLTHMKSAENRQAMHADAATAPVTDSMRMYQWGVEGGRPPAGQVGTAPEWFYKGCGTILRGHLEALVVPAYAGDGGEEPEIAGAYLIDAQGAPRRVGMVVGNEFSDHQMESKNYLYLAPSKLRPCAIGPELVLAPQFADVSGQVRIVRSGATVWQRDLATGETHMCHSLANMEHHHFKYEAHRRPGDAHVHFFGAGAFSFGAGENLEAGDWMEIEFTGFGKPLRNMVEASKSDNPVVAVAAL